MSFDTPQSRNEAILQNMLGADNELLPPESRIETLLQMILEQGSGDAGSYNQLSDKPQIDGTTLQGNKTAAELGLVPSETNKGLSTNDYTNEDKAIVNNVPTKMGQLEDLQTTTKANLVAAINEVVQSGGGDSHVFVAEYGVTTRQEILDYISNTDKPIILVMQGSSFVVISSTYSSLNYIELYSLANGSYLLTYRVGKTGTWQQTSKQVVFQNGLKTINGQSLIGTGDITALTELPTASEDTLGGVKVGNNLSIDENGVLSAAAGGGTFTITGTSYSITPITIAAKTIESCTFSLTVLRGNLVGINTIVVYENESDENPRPLIVAGAGYNSSTKKLNVCIYNPYDVAITVSRVSVNYTYVE